MVTETEKENCCGCHACFSVCEEQRITMQADAEGFWYPVVDQEGCNDCGLCETVCPMSSKSAESNPLAAYACVSNNNDIRRQSSSGGIFSLLAETVINDGGVVFGARFDEDFNVVHDWTDSLDGLGVFRGAKYIQSRMGDGYKEVRDFLARGRQVMFSGTPCQIAGLRSFLEQDNEDLLSVDIVCHGVPSPGVWLRYKQQLEKRFQSRITKVDFRVKDSGWKSYSVAAAFANGTEYRSPADQDIFMGGFLRDLYLRPSCYRCRFKTPYRKSDITLGDFWGIERVLPHMDDDLGTSLVLVNSPKGIRALAGISPNIICEAVDPAEAVRANPCAVKPVGDNPKRDVFFKETNLTEDITGLIEKHIKTGIPTAIWTRIRSGLAGVKRRLF